MQTSSDTLLEPPRMVLSDTVRQLLADGKVRAIADLTGQHYAVAGIVVHGMGRGRALNFPTANLGDEPVGQIAPRDGIYAGWATVRGETFGAAISCGWNPTFAEGRHTVEAHLLNFDDDIYDEQITIYFAERIRDETKFKSVDDLVAQIRRDVEKCDGILRQTSLKKEQ